jgi:RHH-type proline utilization regulon transcriptional repressor/proline dehydrogenase/delta 1-pyrroline-5-carboxylate dehydrogenase
MGKIPFFLTSADSSKNEDKAMRIESIKNVDRVRYLNAKNIEKDIYETAAQDAIHVASETFVGHARVELMHYFLEQSVSDSYHRYGNLGLRALTQEKEG